MVARYFGIVPAAGVGARFGAERPKQYLELSGRTLLEHAVRALLADGRVELVFVVLSVGDKIFGRIDWGGLTQRVAPLFCGGDTRRASVKNGLIAASDLIELDDWVLVHDAARPCLSRADLTTLIDALSVDSVGGILAAPVADTLKRATGDGRIAQTTSREGLWQAQTPQMFRHGTLMRALDAVGAAAELITDEASAVEQLGLAPRLIAATAPNPKVTFPADLVLAQAILQV
jgi:2-C-methyl-D-erythritol 4-phosphate cytidylyltransferase